MKIWREGTNDAIHVKCMDTEHIENALRYIKKHCWPDHHLIRFVSIFEIELIRRYAKKNGIRLIKKQKPCLICGK